MATNIKIIIEMVKEFFSNDHFSTPSGLLPVVCCGTMLNFG